MRLSPSRTAQTGAVLLLACGVLASATPAVAASSHQSHQTLTLPADPQAKGFIAFCGPTGAPVTGGTLATGPFVWKAISSQPPEAQYTGNGRNADLTIYQERPNTLPSEWSGTQLTDATFYSSAAYPTAQATRKDLPLSQIVRDYPPMGAGLYELRMNYAREGAGVDAGTYAASTIQVVGQTWHVVAGGTIPCSNGRGTSNEVITGVTTAAPAAAYAAQVASAQQKVGGSHDSATRPAAGASASTSAGTTLGATTGAGQESVITPTASSAAGSSSSDRLPVTLGVVGGVLIAGVGALFWRRRRT